MSRCLSLAGPDQDRDGDPPGMDSRAEWLRQHMAQVSRSVAAAIVPLLPPADESAAVCSPAWEAAQVRQLATADPDYHDYQPGRTVVGMAWHAILAQVEAGEVAAVLESQGLRLLAGSVLAGADSVGMRPSLRADVEQILARY